MQSTNNPADKFIRKSTMKTLSPLMLYDNKKSYVFKQTCSFYMQGCLSTMTISYHHALDD